LQSSKGILSIFNTKTKEAIVTQSANSDTDILQQLGGFRRCGQIGSKLRMAFLLQVKAYSKFTKLISLP
jgi:hypothetical protein